MGAIETRPAFERQLLWAVFGLFLIVSAYAIYHHELWGDEIHSWNISKGSYGFFDLINNTRYEGHPPVWYTILWTISKFSHNPGYIQGVQFLIGALVVYMVLFLSPYTFSTKILIPFGYYFLFEYGVFTRNYAIGVLLAFCICCIIKSQFKGKTILYYFLLFLLSNTHLLGMILAGSLHLYFLLWKYEQKKTARTVLMHLVIGGIILLPSLVFISPPSDGELKLSYWLSRWNTTQVVMTAQSPLRGFIPIPAWWEFHFWNTQFILQAHRKFNGLKFISPVLSLAVLVLLFLILRKNKKCLILFFVNVFLSFLISIVIFPLTSARHTGYLFIGFLVAYWLYCTESITTQKNKWIINGLLTIQLVAGVFSVSKDIRLPFSNLYKVNELLGKVPPGEQTVSDYWALNALSTFTDKPFYCIDLQKEKMFIFWDSDITAIENTPNRYITGIQKFFRDKDVSKLYMVSLGSPENLNVADPQLSKSFHVELVDKIDGAIEKGSNLYLYRISHY